MPHVIHPHFYGDYLLSCSAMPMECGRFQARVAIAAIRGERTRAQHFLDRGLFDSEAEALADARQAGVDWVDRHAGATRG